jgi:RimJ/RimL family protein N-acetyltransferase
MQREAQPGLQLGPEVEAKASQLPKLVTLRGKYITVRPLKPVNDAESLFEGTHRDYSEQFWAYMSAGPFATVDVFRTYLKRLSDSNDPLSFVIADPVTDRALGHASYMRITPEHRVIEVGNIFFTCWLARTRGATEAIYLMARHVFEDLGYRRYEWKCNSLNLPSKNAAVRFGFTFEGIFKQHMIQKGRNRDTAWFAMLDSEWPDHKAAYEKWLSPENFDATGKEKSRLASYLRPPRR